MRIFSILLLILCSQPGRAQKNIRLSSPDGAIVFSFGLVKQSMIYTLSYKGHLIVDKSPLELRFSNHDLSTGLYLGKPIYRESEEVYTLVTGKTGRVKEHFRELRIPIGQLSGKDAEIYLVVRAFNDGVGFRYEFPVYKKEQSFVLTDEKTTFHLTGDPIVRTLFLPNYTSSHEGPYSTLPLSKVKEDTLMDMPTLFEFPSSGIYLAITESALLDYAGMYLTKEKGLLRSKLSPLPGQTEVKVKASLPHQSPWRVLMISDRIGALIESNLVTNLADSCRIKDLSWIRPGKTTFPWWNGDVVPDTLNAPGNNFVTNQYYIDFCARNGLEYHSVVEYGLHEWYTNDGAGFKPGPDADVTKPVPGLDMKQVCDYAKSKGVGIRVWVYWSALYKKLDSAFAQFEKWGIQGMMVDFLDRDDQEMVNIQTEILKKAAAHHLHIQFHGAYKPTGMSRTYPNEYTREGTRNYEVNKWGPGLTADHDIYIPFTRMLAGSTDYHLGGFRAVPDSLYIAQYTRPLMLSTRCHMLAMYVVLQNALGMVCDYPAAYEGQSGFEFIKQVPTVWDETKVPMARVGEYVVIARKHGDDWYMGSITNHQPRQLTIPLDFLGQGRYSVISYTDAKDAKSNPDDLVKQQYELTNKDSITVQLAAGGGMAMILKKK
jgi:alpha-glucosidase